jgi:hypothetical protein
VDSATKCTACPIGLFLYSPYYICTNDCSNITDVDNSPNLLTRLYGDDDDRKCKTCHEACQVCSGGSSINDCT